MTVRSDDVYDAIIRLDVNKAGGLDNITAEQNCLTCV